MCLFSLLLFLNLCGFLTARHAGVDINRVKLMQNDEELLQHKLTRNPEINTNSRRLIRTRYYDNDDYTSSHPQPRPSLRTLPADASPNTLKEKISVHQPREDPKLFYQSDIYLKEMSKQDINNEVSHIYPSNDVIKADQSVNYTKPLTLETYDTRNVHNFCVKCPSDRILITQPGSEKILFQSLPLKACSGRKAHRSLHFEQWYGPKFGSLLRQGSYAVVGRIAYKNNTLKICKMQIQVIIQDCLIPKYLTAKCDDKKMCNFTCRNPKLDLQGQSRLKCGDDTRWEGNLPACHARNWCLRPEPPKHGRRVSCYGVTPNTDGGALADGAKCRVKCNHGYRGRHMNAACRRGAWTHTLSCVPKRSTIKKKTRRHIMTHL